MNNDGIVLLYRLRAPKVIFTFKQLEGTTNFFKERHDTNVAYVVLSLSHVHRRIVLVIHI